MNHKQLIKTLKKENLNTWFDLCLFLDKIRDKPPPLLNLPNLEKFKEYIKQGLGFITFNLGVDGVSVEKVKYASALKSILNCKDTSIHWIAGDFNPKSAYFSSPSLQKLHLPNIDGFDKWGKAYFALYHTKLERGSKEYNELPPYIWKETLDICKNIGSYIEKHNIRLLVITNINSNPGNLALALAMVLLSHGLGIPVINCNHDFYWEGGKPKQERKPKEPPGVRDHFFLNADVGEVFSFQQMLYPWSSRIWLQANINSTQCKTLIKKIGINPANVIHLTTAVDTTFYRPFNQKEKNEVYRRLSFILSPSGIVKTKKYDWPKLLESNPVVLGIEEDLKLDFSQILFYFLQPTRIISRKRIEKDIDLIEKLLSCPKFYQYFSKHKPKDIILHITGPIAAGHDQYLIKLQARIAEFYKNTPKDIAKRVKIIFTFGQKIESFPTDDPSCVLVSELYGISSLVLLPSITEGRGLPIIESAASCVPIVCSRYKPEEVYQEVIGEGLPQEQKILVLEYPEPSLSSEFVQKVSKILIDKKEREKFISQNREAMERRYSFQALKENFNQILERLWLQSKEDPKEIELAKKALKKIRPSDIERQTRLKEILSAKNRSYIPGYSILGFLIYLKSLIDPSYFRVEERELQSRIYSLAQKLVANLKVEDTQKSLFFNCIQRLFEVTEGEEQIGIDFSFNYRHRTKTHYLYRDMTEQELKGAVVLLSQEIFGQEFDPFTQTGAKVKVINKTLQSLNLIQRSLKTWGDRLQAISCFEIVSSLEDISNLEDIIQEELKKGLTIDDRERFLKKIKEPFHLLHFTAGMANTIAELKLLIEPLLKEWEFNKRTSFSVTIAAKGRAFLDEVTKDDIISLLSRSEFSFLKQKYDQERLKIICTGSLSQGTNLSQASWELVQAIKFINQSHGCITSSGEANYFTLDLVDGDSFRWARASEILGSKIIGVKRGAYIFQFIPAGLRPTLGYPVPLQNAKDFSEEFRSLRYKKLVEKYGGDEARVLKAIKEVVDESGMIVREGIERLLKPEVFSDAIYFSPICGLYSDGHPWTGVWTKLDLAKLKEQGKKVKFVLTKAEKERESVVDMAERYARQSGKEVVLAWNGGYILNAELVGKLGLPEIYIGTPLGLVISERKILALPLYNKPAFILNSTGKISMKRITLNYGGKIYLKGRKDLPSICWKKENINVSWADGEEIHIYNLLYPEDTVPLEQRVGIRIAGNKIVSIVRDGDREVSEGRAKVLPIGIFLTMPAKIYEERYEKFYKTGVYLEFELFWEDFWKDVVLAIEAGPLLVNNSRVDIDLEGEGWNTFNSISTQAARSDRTDLRRPMIAIGVDKDNNLIGLAINGRTRESVGATYEDIANILIQRGCVTAMGFDPGGSATLVVQGKIRNIPPYNSRYEQDPYTLPPEPRFVANAILAIT